MRRAALAAITAALVASGARAQGADAGVLAVGRAELEDDRNPGMSDPELLLRAEELAGSVVPGGGTFLLRGPPDTRGFSCKWMDQAHGTKRCEWRPPGEVSVVRVLELEPRGQGHEVTARSLTFFGGTRAVPCSVYSSVLDLLSRRFGRPLLASKHACPPEGANNFALNACWKRGASFLRLYVQSTPQRFHKVVLHTATSCLDETRAAWMPCGLDP